MLGAGNTAGIEIPADSDALKHPPNGPVRDDPWTPVLDLTDVIDASAAPRATHRTPLADDGWPALREQGSAVPPWGSIARAIEDDSDPFPLDAFIIPEHVRHLPTGFEERQNEIATRVAERLERLARQLRRNGMRSLLSIAPDSDELTRVLAAVVTGFVSRPS